MNLDYNTRVIIKKLANDMALKIATKFGLSHVEVLNCVNDLYDDKCEVSPVESCSSSSSDSSDEGSDEEIKGCCQILKRGPRKNNPCGHKISQKSVTGKYCISHAIQETIGPVDEDNVIESAIEVEKEVLKPKITRQPKGDKIKTSVKDNQPRGDNIKESIVITFDQKYNRYIHLETCLVFNSKKIVYGVQNGLGHIIKLSESDILNCKRFRFIFDKNCCLI